MVVLPLLGIALMYKSSALLFILSSFSLLFVVLVFIVNHKKGAIDEDEVITKRPSTIKGPDSLDEIIEMAENPPYFYQNQNYQEILRALKESLFKNYSWLGLIGHAGIGKSATAEALIDQLANEIIDKGSKVTILRGDCPEKESPDSQVIPYAPFQQVLRKYFNINSFTVPEEHLEFIDNALDGIFESFVPFSGLLFPKSDNHTNDAVSKESMFDSIKTTLTKTI